MDRLSALVLSKPKLIIIILLAITLLLASFIPQLIFDASIEKMIPHDDPVINDLRETSEEFGSQEFFLIAIRSENIFQPAPLEKIHNITQDISNLSGVKNVTTPLTINLIESSDFGIEIRPITATIPTTDQEISNFQKDISQSPYVGRLITEDGRGAAIMVELDRSREDGANRRHQLVGTIESIVHSYEKPEEIFIVGDPYVNYYTENTMRQDLRNLVPFVIIIIASILYASFKSFRGVIIPLITVFCSLIWTLGLMAILGIPVSMVSMVMPIILVTLGSAAGIHILNKYQECLTDSLNKISALRETYRTMSSPVAMAAFTTAAGFAALITSFVAPIRLFGLLTAFGVLTAMLFSLTFIPAVLLLLTVPKTLPDKRKQQQGLGKILAILANFASKKSKTVLVTAFLLLIVFALGAFRLNLESNILNYFAQDSPIIRGTNIVEEEFGGSMQLSIVFDTDREDGIKEPHVLQQMVEFQEFLQSLEHVNHPSSIADLVRELNQAFWEGEEEYYRIPDSRQAIAQQLLLFTMQGGSGIESLVSYNFERALVTAQMKSLDASQMASVIDKVETYVVDNFNAQEDLQVKVVGMPKVMLTLMDRYVQTQIHSLITSTLAVGIIVSLLMGSIAIGLLCLLPLIFTVVINFGIMGYVGIPLDAVTTIIASIAIGIGIDYSIHYVNRYRLEKQKINNTDEVIMITSCSAGRSIFYNALALITGFLILVFSHFHAISVFGSLIATTMLISSLAALTVIPAMLKILPQKITQNKEKDKKRISKNV